MAQPGGYLKGMEREAPYFNEYIPGGCSVTIGGRNCWMRGQDVIIFNEYRVLKQKEDEMRQKQINEKFNNEKQRKMTETLNEIMKVVSADESLQQRISDIWSK